MAKPNWKINKIARMMECTMTEFNPPRKTKVYAGLYDVNNKHDDLLWFTHEEDLEYICEALNFYETYRPLFKELKEDLKCVLNHLEETEKLEKEKDQ